MEGSARFLVDATGRPDYKALNTWASQLPDEKKATAFGTAIGSERYWDTLATGALRRYWFFTILTLASGGAIAVIATLNGIYKSNTTTWAILTAVLGVAVTFFKGYDAAFPSRDVWVRARNTQQQLWTERDFYFTRTGIYQNSSDEEAFALYEPRMQAIRSGELQEWSRSVLPQKPAPAPSEVTPPKQPSPPSSTDTPPAHPTDQSPLPSP